MRTSRFACLVLQRISSSWITAKLRLANENSLQPPMEG
jgi:hypothetical protein